jgi:DNA-binding GntR family transcriptional regulator
MIATNAAFHSAIAAAGRNHYYANFFERLLVDGRRILRLYYQSYEDRLPTRFVEEHEEIIAAIEARDVDAADRLGKIHAEQIVEQIGRLLTRYDPGNIVL